MKQQKTVSGKRKISSLATNKAKKTFAYFSSRLSTKPQNFTKANSFQRKDNTNGPSFKIGNFVFQSWGFFLLCCPPPLYHEHKSRVLPIKSDGFNAQKSAIMMQQLNLRRQLVETSSNNLYFVIPSVWHGSFAYKSYYLLLNRRPGAYF